MIKLEAGVGKGLANNLHDVALVQAALKLIRNDGRQYFSAKIDGKATAELFGTLEKFYLDHFGDGKTKKPGKTSGGVDTKPVYQLRPNSPLLAAINKKLPSTMSSLVAIRHSALLYIRDATQPAELNPYVFFPFPLSIGKPLTKALDILFKGYGNRLHKSQHITAEFSGFDVTETGNYKLLINFPAIKFIDSNTAKASWAIPSEFVRIVRADLRQRDWKIGRLETKGGVNGISATSVRRAPFKGTALILPKFVTGTPISKIRGMSSDKVVRKMILVSLIHMFDIDNRLPEKDIRDILEILNSSIFGFMPEYTEVLKKMLDGPQTVRGCGSIDVDVPDHPFGYDFLPACENHDRRYTYLNWTKKEADDAFLEELLEACPPWVNLIVNPVLGLSVRSFCQRLAYIYWRGVDQFGSEAHFEAQEEAQKYGWIDKNKPYDPSIHGRYVGQLPPIERQESIPEAALRYGAKFLEEVALVSDALLDT